MKRKLLLICIFVILLTGCDKKKTAGYGMSEQNMGNSVDTNITKIDFDLSKMNYNMISSITFEMLVEPEKYMNKTVKIKGQFYSGVYEERRTYSVIIWDSTRCCPTGLDFIPPENMIFPQDFPADDSEVTVIGTMILPEGEDNLIFVASQIIMN